MPRKTTEEIEKEKEDLEKEDKENLETQNQILEREVNLSLINEKLNLIINALMDIKAKD